VDQALRLRSVVALVRVQPAVPSVIHAGSHAARIAGALSWGKPETMAAQEAGRTEDQQRPGPRMATFIQADRTEPAFLPPATQVRILPWVPICTRFSKSARVFQTMPLKFIWVNRPLVRVRKVVRFHPGAPINGGCRRVCEWPPNSCTRAWWKVSRQSGYNTPTILPSKH
jgi:hypothetical protein